jgi:plastocyanin
MGAAVALGQGGGGNPTVTAQANNTFNPAAVSIEQNHTVTWMNSGGGNHNVHFSGEAALAAPSTSNWTVQKTFPTVGTFGYVCDIHPGMTGTVTVTAATTTGTTGTTTTGTTTTGTTTTPTTPTDTARPVVNRLRTGTVTLRRAVVRLRLNEDSKVTARLRRRGSTRTLKRVTRDLRAGDGSLTIRYTLRPRARYRVALEVEDAAGNVTRRSVSFRAPRS